MSKVYVTQESNLDYRRAEEFGELVFMAVDKRDDFNNVPNGEHNARLIAHLRQKLRDFDEDNDYLVITGGPYVNAAVFALLGRRGVKKLRILRWDNRDYVYIPMSLNLD